MQSSGLAALFALLGLAWAVAKLAAKAAAWPFKAAFRVLAWVYRKFRISRLMERDYSRADEFDYPLLWLAVGLFVLGLLAIFSVDAKLDPAVFEQIKSLPQPSANESWVWRTKLYSSGEFLRQLGFGVGGAVVMAVLFRIDGFLDWLERNALWVGWLLFAAMAAAAFFGETRNGARRWLSFGGFAVQPAEFCKFGMCVLMAHYLSAKFSWRGWAGWGRFFFLLGVGAVGVALSALTRDFGALVIFSAIMFCCMTYRGMTFWQLGAMTLIGGVVAFVSVVSQDHRIARLASFARRTAGVDNTLTQEGIARDISQHVDAWGSGLGNSIQRTYMTQQSTDYVFAMIAEQLGAVGMLCVIAAFALLIIRMAQIAYNSSNGEANFRSVCGVGVTTWFAVQTLIHIAVNVGGPSKGLTLPLVSYGGSSLVASIGAVAFMLMVDAENRRLDRRIHESELAAQAASRVAVSAD